MPVQVATAGLNSLMLSYRYIFVFSDFSCFPELRGNADEEFEVDAGHGAREYRKVVLVEEVVDGEFQLDVHRFKKQVFLQRDIAHEILGQVSCQRIVVARHGVTFRVERPFVKERPSPPRQPSGQRCGVLRYVG